MRLSRQKIRKLIQFQRGVMRDYRMWPGSKPCDRRNVSFREVPAALGDIEPRLGREVNVTIYDRARLLDAIAAGDPFISHVLASPKT